MAKALRERRPRSAGVSAAGLRMQPSGLSISSLLVPSLGWFGRGSEGEALASDLPQICRRFGLSITRLLALGCTLLLRFVS